MSDKKELRLARSKLEIVRTICALVAAISAVCVLIINLVVYVF